MIVSRINLVVIGAILVVLSPAFGVIVDSNEYVKSEKNDLSDDFHLADSLEQRALGEDAEGKGRGPIFATYPSPQKNPSTLSISFLFSAGDASPTGGVNTRLGWAGNPIKIDYFLPGIYLYAEFYNDSGFAVFNFPTGSPGVAPILIGNIATPEFDHWLTFTLTTTSLGASEFGVAVRLEDTGPDRLSTPSLLFEHSLVVTNPAMAADSSVYGGFYGDLRAPRFEDFTINDVTTAAVPEPHTFSMFIISLLIIPFVWSRVRRV